MPDVHYEDPRLAQIYDLDSGWSEDRDFYLALPVKAEQHILDMGCGTGLLCNAYAEKGHHVTGADPSAAMLNVARRKPHGSAIEWVQSAAQTYKSDKRFDLIIMTGHAFQVLLTEQDILAAFAAMKHHLRAGGMIVFESRNPGIDWAPRWNYEIELDTPAGIVRESRHFISIADGIMQFELRYQFPDRQVLASASTLRFSPRETIERLLTASGLKADNIFGDWSRNPFDSNASEEMIFVVGADDN
ncbi:MAG: class I SAM-dependent methyltransferase [Candidatus Obscuribacterales bacterium]